MRQLCSTALLGAAGATLSACGSTAADLADDGGEVRFLHGVASGDPLADRVILWTRVTPPASQDGADLPVQWILASDEAMRQVVASGTETTGAGQDYTVKVDATGLLAGHVYHYRFSCAGIKSPQGRTRTLPPADVKQVTLAVFSCSNYPAGYFNVYAAAAQQGGFDVALHIGDYIYEYDARGYASANSVALGRVSEPRETLLALDDYRRRYAQYRSDADLQALHAAVPFIVVWDDHELADDTWRDSAVDHLPSRHGPFSVRKAAAIRAYHEWLPIRLPDPARPDLVYRSFDFGKLLSLHMLDTRLIGRDQQLMLASYYDHQRRFDAAKFRADLDAPQRQMLGTEQLAWLERQVTASTARWQVLGQQVLMARMEFPLPVVMGQLSRAAYVALKQRDSDTLNEQPLTEQERAWLAAPTLPCYMDSWDGYPQERERVLALMRGQRKNLVVLAGDTHNAWASDLHDAGGAQVGVEFATASVSSPGLEGAYPKRDPGDVARMMEQLIGPLYYAQTSKRGYMVITVTMDEARVDWRFVDTVHSRQFSALTERSLRTLAGPAGRKIVEC